MTEINNCKFCNKNTNEDELVTLLGIKMCKDCYYDILNQMSYNSIDNLLDNDKKRLMKFLNELALKERERNERKNSNKNKNSKT